MPTTDPARARSRYRRAIERTREGLIRQRQRQQERYDAAPRLIPDNPIPIVDMRGDHGLDLDYYIYELGRLQDIAREMLRSFDGPAEVVTALEAFDAGIPNLRRIRNPLTHVDDTARLDDVAWFSSVVLLSDFGRSEDLVDPRYGHHDAAMALADALENFLARSP